MLVDNKAVFRRYVEELWNRKNIAAIDELIAPDFVGRIAGSPDIRGLEGYKQFFLATCTAFPDLQNTVESVVAEGDAVAARWTSRGTHKGEYLGIAPTGKYVTGTLTAIYRIVNGKIAECYGDADNLGLLQQLGVVSLPG